MTGFSFRDPSLTHLPLTEVLIAAHRKSKERRFPSQICGAGAEGGRTDEAVIAHDVPMNIHSVSLGHIGLRLSKSCLSDCITIKTKVDSCC